MTEPIYGLWEIKLAEDWPVRVLERLGPVALEFPGQDELRIIVGERRLVLSVEDGPQLRDAVRRIVREESGCEL